MWYTRRAGTRAKSELIAAIYDKALKRRDYSGIIKKDEEKEKEDAKEGEKKKDGIAGRMIPRRAQISARLST